MAATHPQRWIYPTPQGLFCLPGGFHIDPAHAVESALITHGHGDHARPGHGRVLATRETGAIMKVRLGSEAAGDIAAATPGESIRIKDVVVRFVPAGHILGSAQIVIEHAGSRVVISGDYKRAGDPTCAAFEPVACDLFITEATFRLPVFCHEPPQQEVARLLASIGSNPDRAHLLGVYGLGKCQRIIVLLRQAGFDAPIFLHGALVGLCALYERLGIPLGDLRPVQEAKGQRFEGCLVLCRPRRSPTAGPAALVMRSPALPLAGCVCAGGRGSAAWSCRSSYPITPTGLISSPPSGRPERRRSG